MTDPQQNDTQPEQAPSGIDLAREALAAYKKHTWAIPSKTPGPAKPKPRRAIRSGDRRDPAPVRTTFADISTDPRWEAGLTGGSIIDQWPTLCPQYLGLVQPVHYEAATGRLDLRPGSHSYAAQLRLLGGQLAKQVNDKLGRPAVRSIRVLPVGAIATPQPAADDDPGTFVRPPVRTRDDGCPGYQDALAAAIQHKPPTPSVDPYVEEAMRRQETALRAARLHGTEQDSKPARPARDRVEESLVRARAYARQQRAGREPRRAFDVV